jgi:hypothetical protein
MGNPELAAATGFATECAEPHLHRRMGGTA